MADEKKFENEVKKWLETQGVYPAGCPSDRMKVPPTGWYFKVWGGGFQKSGIPDLIANVEGNFVAIELKAQRGRPAELQIHNVNQIRDTNGCACFLYPSGFEEFKRDLFKHHLKEVYK